MAGKRGARHGAHFGHAAQIDSCSSDPFLDSDLFQLKWRPATTSLRYVSKIPPLNYQSLLGIFFFSLSLSHLAFQGMENEILIPSSIVLNAYYLRPMGDTNPLDFIN